MQGQVHPAMVDKTVTMFWHGVPAEFDDKGNVFRAAVDSGSPYVGIVLKEGELSPWIATGTKNTPPERS